MLTIIDRIDDARVELLTAGTHAATIYLGKQEWAELAALKPESQEAIVDIPDGRYLHGIRCVEVAADAFLSLEGTGTGSLAILASDRDKWQQEAEKLRVDVQELEWALQMSQDAVGDLSKKLFELADTLPEGVGESSQEVHP